VWGLLFILHFSLHCHVMRFFCAFLSIVWLHCFFCNAMCSRSEMEMQNFMAVGSLAISFFLFFFLAESVTFCVYYLLSISQGCSFLLSRSNLLALASCKPWGLEVELSDSMFVPCTPPPPPPSPSVHRIRIWKTYTDVSICAYHFHGRCFEFSSSANLW
jgi:hypothetical protein